MQTSAPLPKLFIYYLAGHPEMSGMDDSAHFIGCWPEDDFSFLFFSRPAPAEIDRLLAQQPALKLLDEYRFTLAEWHGGVLEPFTVGSFRVSPPWCDPPRECTAKHHLLLDPGVVFGAGNHPTTQSCLTALELAMHDSGGAQKVLDLGTGTGLLALAAAQLGARRVLAVDFNLLAVRTAHRNIALNGLQQRILAVQGRAEDFVDGLSDLLIANIHFDVLQRLIQTSAFYRKKRFILSGLMRSEARKTADLLSRAPATILHEWTPDGIWHTFYGKTLA